MMSPFFNDHTSYGAMIAFFIPLNIAVLFVHNKNIIIKFTVSCMLFILFIGLVLSFTRAAWLSLFLAVIGGLVLRYKINRKLLFSSPLIIILAGFLLQGYILMNHI